MHCKCKSDGSKYVNHFTTSVNVKDRYIVKGDTNLFPEQFDDPQKIWSLCGVGVARAPTQSKATISLADPWV